MSLWEVIVMFGSLIGSLVLFIVCSSISDRYITENTYFYGIAAGLSYIILFFVFLPFTSETKRLLHGSRRFHQSNIIVADANAWDFAYVGAGIAFAIYGFFAWFNIAHKHGSSYDGVFNDPTYLEFSDIFKIIVAVVILAVILHFVL